MATGVMIPVNEYLSDLEVTDKTTISRIMRENLKGLLEGTVLAP